MTLFRKRIDMFCIMGMKLFAKEMKQGEEEHEDHSHESEDSRNTV